MDVLKIFTIIISFIFHLTTAAEDCTRYEKHLDQLHNKKVKTGKAKQVDSNRSQVNTYEAELYKCKNLKKIVIVTNAKRNSIKSERWKLQPIDTEDAQLQALIKTCNYWINENNLFPSFHNTNYRNTACRAANDYKMLTLNAASPIAPNIRSLKDCIKPNNVIDNQVSECMKGNVEAAWKK